MRPAAHPLRRLLAAVAITLACAVAAWATVVVHADIPRLASLADLVVDGRVESRRTVYDADAGAIWTVHRIAVISTLLGAAPGNLDVYVPGGRVGDLEQDVSGTPRMTEGSRAVLFLAKSDANGSDDRFQVLGQAQGCFRVTRDADGELVCRNDLKGLALVDADGRHIETDPIVVTHADLLARIRAAVEARDAERARRKAAIEARLARQAERAEDSARRTRGKPGGAQ